MGRAAVFAVVTVLAISTLGCATSFEVVELPERSADLYPLALGRGEATVAVDEIRDPERAFRYFGVDLLARDIVPVNIVVSNHRARPLLVKPADVLLHRGDQILDPLPVSKVAAFAKRQGRLNRETKEQVDAYYRELAFKTTAVPPNGTYQGVLFFRVPGAKSDRDSLFRRVSLWMQGDLQLDVVVETVDERERLRFGPFVLEGTGRDRWL